MRRRPSQASDKPLATEDRAAGSAGSTGFHAHAGTYADTWGADPVAKCMRQVTHRIMERFFPEKGRILDLGCGIGIDSEHLVETGRSVLSVDATAEMVRQTQARVPEAEAHQASIETLDEVVDAQSVDGAILNFGVINCVDPVVAGAALARAVRPGGHVILVSMPRFAPTWMLSALLRGDWGGFRARAAKETWVDVEGEAIQTRYHSNDTIIRAFETEFQVVDQLGMGFLMPPPRGGTGERWVNVLDRIEAPLRRMPVLRGIGDHTVIVLHRRAMG